MTDDRDDWALSAHAWVPLKGLLHRVRERFGVGPDIAAPLLRTLLASRQIASGIEPHRVEHPSERLRREIEWREAKTRQAEAEVRLKTRQLKDDDLRFSTSSFAIPPTHAIIPQATSGTVEGNGGWEKVDWAEGVAGIFPIEVSWTELARVLPVEAAKGRTSADEQDTHEWMRAYAQVAIDNRSDGEPPKRDDAIKMCMEAKGVTYREALAAYNAMPTKLRRPPRRPKKSGTVSRA